MLTKEELIPLIKKYSLLTIEVDDRHMEVINEVFKLGVNVGINQAKEAICWRINGAMWADFIDKGDTYATTQTETNRKP